MGTVRNVSADARYVPLLDRQLDPDEVVDVPDDLLDPENRSWDPEVWQVETAVQDSRTVAELRADLESRGLPTAGKKSELIDRLAQPDDRSGESQ